MTADSMASFNIGVFYILAALDDMKQFHKWTVPFCCVTFVVFTIAVPTNLAPARFIGVGASELTGAVATGLALLTVVTGQPLKYFDDVESARSWLTED
jgi:hypothetical protein